MPGNRRAGFGREPRGTDKQHTGTAPPTDSCEHLLWVRDVSFDEGHFQATTGACRVSRRPTETPPTRSCESQRLRTLPPRYDITHTTSTGPSARSLQYDIAVGHKAQESGMPEPWLPTSS